MNFLRAIVGIVVMIGLAFLLSRAREVEHRASHLYAWLGAITVLLILGAWL